MIARRNSIQPRYNIAVCGARGAGKTCLINRLSRNEYSDEYDQANEDCATIEDIECFAPDKRKQQQQQQQQSRWPGATTLCITMSLQCFLQDALGGDVEDEYDLHDLVSKEEYSTLVEEYLRLADGFVLVFDLTSRRSFNEMLALRRTITKLLLPVAATREIKHNDHCRDISTDSLSAASIDSTETSALPFVPICIVGTKSDLATESERAIRTEEVQILCQSWTSENGGVPVVYWEASAKNDSNVREPFMHVLRLIHSAANGLGSMEATSAITTTTTTTTTTIGTPTEITTTAKTSSRSAIIIDVQQEQEQQQHQQQQRQNQLAASQKKVNFSLMARLRSLMARHKQRSSKHSERNSTKKKKKNTSDQVGAPPATTHKAAPHSTCAR